MAAILIISGLELIVEAIKWLNQSLSLKSILVSALVLIVKLGLALGIAWAVNTDSHQLAYLNSKK